MSKPPNTVRIDLDQRNARARTLFEATLALALLLVTWSLSHRYKGLTQDGELYAFQAMARLNPSLRADVYLMANSQDDFTLFSPLYALLIRCLGLWNASVTLFAFCTLSFIAAAWSVARSLWDESRAWLCAAACIVIVCGYGGYGVFTYSENYLTARSMAEAMVIVALAFHLHGFRLWSWTIAAASMLVHPLMALPGLLLLACLSVRLTHAALGAFSGFLTTLIIAVLATRIGNSLHFLEIIRGPWLEMVWERSQYLFLQNWRVSDWETQVRPLLCLSISITSAVQPRVRRLCISAMLVGVAGLAVAVVSSEIGPVAILLQGQAWRWFWVTGFVSVLMLAPTAVSLWKHGECGAVCAILLLASWTFAPAAGTTFSAAALLLWGLRRRLPLRAHGVLRMSAYAMVIVILAHTIGDLWALISSSRAEALSEPMLVERLRGIHSLQIPALAIFGFALWWLRSGTNVYASGVILSVLLTICAFELPGSFDRNSKSNTIDAIAPAEWRAVIPPASNVLAVPSTAAAGFIWFSLNRPSYLTVNQSAGVVFSPDTAREIRRRSEILSPIMPPDWKIRSQLSHAQKTEEPTPLTVSTLTTICRDPELGFVIAKERLGFDAIPSSERGHWKDWNLYDCSRVLSRE